MEELIVSVLRIKLSSRTCSPEEGRRGTLRQIALTMRLVGPHGACGVAVLFTSVVVHAHRKIPLSSAYGERVRDDSIS